MCLHKFTQAVKVFYNLTGSGCFCILPWFRFILLVLWFPSGATAARLFPSAFGVALPNEFTQRAKNTRPKEALACFKLPVAF